MHMKRKPCITQDTSFVFLLEMDPMAERIAKLREERREREKARIEKLRELNLKKYNQEPSKNTPANVRNVSKNMAKNHVPLVSKINNSAPQSKTESKENRAKSAPTHRNNPIANKSARKPLAVSSDQGPIRGPSQLFNNQKKTTDRKTSFINFNKTNLHPKFERKSLAPTNIKSTTLTNKQKPKLSTASNVSVFERLYKPKITQNTNTTNVNRRHTVFNNKPEHKVPVRRSISAVHLKRVNKSELGNCIHKWSSSVDKLNIIDIKEVNEDETVNDDKVVSAIKSERKRVTFMTPCTNFNTPRQEELQARLKAWLHKRGKSMDSYHHLQCFGLHHLPYSLKFDPTLYKDENKENVFEESDSDDDSYTENMNDEMENKNKWRRASIASDSVDLSESQNTTTTNSDAIINTDEIVIGALNDLTELLKEGFEWMQCARWLRAVRERFPSVQRRAAYWECRAALEERRGDLPASLKCWEEAIAQGTEHSVAEANLDHLLDKFMQLQISPNGEKSQRVDAKYVDVKNVFKSSIIRFAVQRGKFRLSSQEAVSDGARCSLTPVRRSARLSSARTPLQLCSSVAHAPSHAVFVPNPHLYTTP
ncbi:unnamed protein product [Arctia plantaginis]|uniref:Cytoskeleton-associated protein 2-like n=1 Tax=Arctia plantaginis TaxID=874455 RepID=A0A8S1BGH9_ARCPL|nr:unnamed protein product [Arctia plantaginis]